MSQTTTCRRRIRRHVLPTRGDASIEFCYPEGGQRERFRLLDLSVSGLSFLLDQNAPTLEAGLDLSNVVLRVANCEIRGDLLVMHVTADSASQSQCGALFYPASDIELIKLKSVVAGIEAMQAD